MPIPPSTLDVASLPVLCVDLDGTLVKSDTLHDSALAVVRHRPVALLRIPGWLVHGKAALKRHLANVLYRRLHAWAEHAPAMNLLT